MYVRFINEFHFVHHPEKYVRGSREEGLVVVRPDQKEQCAIDENCGQTTPPPHNYPVVNKSIKLGRFRRIFYIYVLGNVCVCMILPTVSDLPRYRWPFN